MHKVWNIIFMLFRRLQYLIFDIATISIAQELKVAKMLQNFQAVKICRHPFHQLGNDLE